MDKELTGCSIALVLLFVLTQWPQPADGGAGCYRLQNVGMCTALNPPIAKGLECAPPCNFTECDECAGPAWVLTPQPIWGCTSGHPRGLDDCTNTGSFVYVKKTNYTCDPTTHCYVKVNTVDYGAGCESATLLGNNCEQ